MLYCSSIASRSDVLADERASIALARTRAKGKWRATETVPPSDSEEEEDEHVNGDSDVGPSRSCIYN